MCTRPGFGLLIAYANMIIYGIIAIFFVILLANKKLFNEMVDEESSKSGIDPVEFKKVLRGTLIFFVLLCLALITVSGIMARGINKRRHRYMAPWLFICAIAILSSLVYTCLLLFKLKKGGGKFAVGLCLTVIQIVVVYPIYSLYRDIRMENQ